MGYAQDTKKSVDQLNSYLRGELSAVETYRLALEKIDDNDSARATLQTCMESHRTRVSQIRQSILAVGGTPSDGSGAWGAFAKAVEGSATVFGDKAAIAALEAGEDRGLADYRVDTTKLDAVSRELVTSKLLPEQEQTHRNMSILKKQLQ